MGVIQTVLSITSLFSLTASAWMSSAQTSFKRYSNPYKLLPLHLTERTSIMEIQTDFQLFVPARLLVLFLIEDLGYGRVSVFLYGTLQEQRGIWVSPPYAKTNLT